MQTIEAAHESEPSSSPHAAFRNSEDLSDEWRGAQRVVCGDSERLTHRFIPAEEWGNLLHSPVLDLQYYSAEFRKIFSFPNWSILLNVFTKQNNFWMFFSGGCCLLFSLKIVKIITKENNLNWVTAFLFFKKEGKTTSEQTFGEKTEYVGSFIYWIIHFEGIVEPTKKKIGT